ncbi:MAG: hypothetical protein GJU76_12955 [Gallionella sp.]|nr:hypothetical protein [Gallionella sp.]
MALTEAGLRIPAVGIGVRLRVIRRSLEGMPGRTAFTVRIVPGNAAEVGWQSATLHSFPALDLIQECRGGDLE